MRKTRRRCDGCSSSKAGPQDIRSSCTWGTRARSTSGLARFRHRRGFFAARFWPGPLTLVLKRTNRASDLVTGEQDTVALRVPAHPVALEILRAFGGGVIAPSANRFGHVSATRAEHVRADFGEAIDLVIDGGPATIGVESTILDLASGAPSILRPGAITRAMLEEVLGEPVALGSARGVRAPGTLPTHYAPRARVELANDAGEAETRAATLRTGGERVVVIGAGEATARFARELYAWMRAADQSGTDVIVVVLPPESGLGSAIRDRLERAAGGSP